MFFLGQTDGNVLTKRKLKSVAERTVVEGSTELLIPSHGASNIELIVLHEDTGELSQETILMETHNQQLNIEVQKHSFTVACPGLRSPSSFTLKTPEIFLQRS